MIPILGFLSASVLVQMFLFGLVALLVAYYFYSTKNFDLFKRYGIPGPTPKPFLFNFSEYGSEIFLGDAKLLKKYGNGGDVVGFHEGMWPIILIAKPELLRQIMVKEFANFTERRDIEIGAKQLKTGVSLVHGEDWKRIRSALSPTFSTGKMRQLYPLLQQCVNQACDKLTGTKLDEPVDCKTFFNNYTLDAVAASFFGVKISDDKSERSPYVTNANKLFSFSMRNLVAIFVVFCPPITSWLSKAGFSMLPLDSLDFFDATIRKVIKARREESANKFTKNAASGQQRKQDFLDLVLARDDADDEQHVKEADVHTNGINNYTSVTDSEQTASNGMQNGNKSTSAKKLHARKPASYLSDEEIIAQSIIFLLAGYEPAASELSFVVSALASYPDVQDRLRDEVTKAYENNDSKELTYEQINNGLPYMDQCFQETMRMWPSATRTERAALREIDLGEVTIPAGAVVAVPIYYIHHNEKYWPEPEEFNPDRFSADAKIEPYTYMPFGEGPRNCVGMRFALLEMKVMLATLVRRFRILPVPGKTEKQPELCSSRGILKSKNGLWVKFEAL